MELPLISKQSKFPHYPTDTICPICGTDRSTLNSECYILSGGAIKKSGAESYSQDENLSGFLSMSYHSAKNSTQSAKMLDIINHSKNGQFDVYFCSAACMRIFFNAIVDEMETKK